MFGLERIDYQKNSKLASGLVGIFQEVFDYAQSTSSGKLTSMSEVKERISQINKFLQTTTEKKVIALVKREMNLTAEMKFYGDVTYMSAAASFNFNNRQLEKVHMDLFDNFSGTLDLSTKYSPGRLKKVSEELKNYESVVDLQTGRYVGPTSYTVTLHMFVSSFITGEWQSYVEPLSAEEIAAVMLHELGHCLTLVEHMAKMYYHADVITDSIKYLRSRKPSNEDVDTIQKTTEDIIDTLVKQGVCKNTSFVVRLANTVRSDKRKSGEIIGLAVIILLPFILALLLNVLSFGLLASLVFADARRYGELNRGKVKTSDTVVTYRNQSYAEYVADEFVARHGLAAAFASGFYKVSNYYIREKKPINPIGANMDIVDAYKYQLTFSEGLSKVIGQMAVMAGNLYEDDRERIDNVLNDTYAVFKDFTMSPETKNKYIKDVDEIRRILRLFDVTNTHKTLESFFSSVLQITTRTTISDAISDANLSADYDKLQRATNGLIRNPLYYNAAKLDSLTKNA